MSVDTTQLKAEAQALKNASRELRVIKFCDQVLGWQPERVVMPNTKPEPVRAAEHKTQPDACPACEARRRAKALAMQRYRWRKDMK